MATQSNRDLVERAQHVIPGGVNSGNRALPWPLAIVEATGTYFSDAEGRRYLDYHAAFGPLILGHKTMCEHGIFMIPTALKRNHVSAAHTDADIDLTLETARHVLGNLPATVE